ncbi:hypothetical protein PILCRDRAFT_6155 [Piloderma croceum F 1598]|uniref:Uncharacterized protein n=1 Tax=Piloderma croceum (strain F 1598) TaxID=765440 RepID=A0A0C3FJ91_PILCF|nr:hypothetical protein PILCRDRAFT_6155 [Piloderma croceum F 1598]
MTSTADLDLELQRIHPEPHMTRADITSAYHDQNPSQTMEAPGCDPSIHIGLRKAQAELNLFLADHIDKMTTLKRSLRTTPGSFEVNASTHLHYNENRHQDRSGSSVHASHATSRITNPLNVSSIHEPSSSQQNSEVQIQITASDGESASTGGRVEADAIPRRDSAVNALTPQFAGDNIAPSAAYTVVPATLTCDPLESHLRQIHIFLDSHMHNVRSLQNSIVTALTESGDGVLSPSSGSVPEEAEPLLPSLVPDIKQIHVSDNPREKAEKDRHQELSKQFSTLVLIATFLVSIILATMSLIQSIAPVARAATYMWGFLSLGIVFTAAMLAGMGASMTVFVSSTWMKGMLSPQFDNRLIICVVFLYIGTFFFIIMVGTYLLSDFIDQALGARISWAQLAFGSFILSTMAYDLYVVFLRLHPSRKVRDYLMSSRQFFYYWIQ